MLAKKQKEWILALYLFKSGIPLGNSKLITEKANDFESSRFGQWNHSRKKKGNAGALS